MAQKRNLELIGKRRGHATKKYRIVIDARGISRTTGRYYRGLLAYLPEFDQRNEYHVLINPSDQGSWKPEAKNFTLHIVPFAHYSFSEQLGFARYLRKMKPDLVHFLMPQQPLLYFGKRVTSILDLTLVHFQNIDKNKTIYTIEQKIFTFLLKNVAKRSKHVLTISRYVKEDIANFTGIQKKKITVTYPAAEKLSSTHSEPVSLLQDKKYIMFVGNAFPHKNLTRLIEAFALFRDTHPDYELVFVGKKDFFYKKHQEYVKEHQHSNIHFLGFVPDEKLVWLYKNAQMYAFPSLSEGFGLPGLEAMVYKVPVVSSNATCLPEIYQKAAVYFDPENLEDMAQAMSKVADSEKLRAKLIATGQKRLGDFSWHTMAKQTHSVYMKILK